MSDQLSNRNKSKVVFNDGSANVKPSPEFYTNTIYKSNDRKRWEFIQVSPCPFNEGFAWVIQRLQGDFGTPNEDGHDASGWRPEPEPAKTRLVYMEMLDNGTVVNVYKDKKTENRS